MSSAASRIRPGRSSSVTRIGSCSGPTPGPTPRSTGSTTGSSRHGTSRSTTGPRMSRARGVGRSTGSVCPTTSLRADLPRERAARPPAGPAVVSGTLRVGTSGFAYPAWAPTFYPPGLRGEDLLRAYAERLQRVRAQQHVLPPADREGRRRLACPDARVVPVRRQGPAQWRHAGAARRRPGRERRLAHPAARRVRLSARQRALPGPGRGRPDRGAPRPAGPAPGPVAAPGSR